MPTLEKMSDDEVQALKTGRRPSKRKQIRQQYMDIINSLEVGEGGVLSLEEGENRITARNRLRAAAKSLDKHVTFYRTRGPRIRFIVGDGAGPDEAPAKAPKATKKPGSRRKKSS